MVLAIRFFLLSLILTQSLNIGFSAHAHASLSCSQFTKQTSSQSSAAKNEGSRRSIGYYLNSVAQIPRFEPKFLDPAAEAKLSDKWAGTQEAPLLLKQTLLENTALIDRPLLAADAGTVKSATAASYVSMRLRHTWNGKDMSTNLGVSADSLVAKTMEGSNKLVPKTAKAVYLFMHGWGTKTTGHHVAAAISNFMAPYGIVVMSIDAPHHAYGPRVADLSPKEYATYLRDFRNEFIPEGVPTFIGGHSGGGFIADMMMRFSDDKDLGLKEAFKGAINLSGPMDGAPGKSLAEKAAAEERINTNEELMMLVPEEERDLSVLLLTQGKTSATSGLSAETFMSSVNWSKPKHGGSEYLPTLVVMGERDGLYVGREKIFEEYLGALSNTETHVMGLRPNFKGADAWVSHMIFDHYRPGTKDPETFNVIKDFIEKQVGTELKKVNGSSLITNVDGSKAGIIVNVVQEYYNNIAFRLFAQEFEMTVKIASPEAQQLGAITGKLTKERKALATLIKKAKKEAPDSPETKALLEDDARIAAKLEETRGKMTSKFIPEGENKDFAQNNIARRSEIEDRINKALKAKQNGAKELRALRDETAKNQKAFDAAVEKILWDESLKTPEAKGVLAKINGRLQEMIALQEKMNEMNSSLVAKNIEQGVFSVNPGEKEIAVYKELDAAYAAYNEAMAEGRRVVAKAIGKGATTKEENTLFSLLYGSVEAFSNDQPTPESLLGRTQTKENEVNQAESEYNKLSAEREHLIQEYVERVTPGLYTFRTTRLADELNKPLTELIKAASGIEPIWRVWSDLWKERPPEQGTSLY